MLKALGMNKREGSTLANEDQCMKYREQLRTRNMWRKDVDQVQTIIHKLNHEYGHHKGDFAVARYEKLKAMIKESIKNYEEALQMHKERENKLMDEKVANRRAGEERGSAGSRGRDSSDSSLDGCWEMTARQIEEDTERFRKEVIQLKQDFRNGKAKLDKLTKDYQDSKKKDPTNRYVILKQLIKDITRDRPTK